MGIIVKKSNKKINFNIFLERNEDILEESNYVYTLNLQERYTSDRNNSNKYRLSGSLNLITFNNLSIDDIVNNYIFEVYYGIEKTKLLGLMVKNENLNSEIKTLTTKYNYENIEYNDIKHNLNINDIIYIHEVKQTFVVNNIISDTEFEISDNSLLLNYSYLTISKVELINDVLIETDYYLCKGKKLGELFLRKNSFNKDIYNNNSYLYFNNFELDLSNLLDENELPVTNLFIKIKHKTNNEYFLNRRVYTDDDLLGIFSFNNYSFEFGINQINKIKKENFLFDSIIQIPVKKFFNTTFETDDITLIGPNAKFINNLGLWVWREILLYGSFDEQENFNYPFVSGTNYINKDITLIIKPQDITILSNYNDVNNLINNLKDKIKTKDINNQFEC